jgi:ATP-dependent DNA helicase RecG
MQEKKLSLSTPLRYFKGVGPKRGEHLSGAGLRTAEDLIYYLPARYEDRSTILPIKDLKVGEFQTVRGDIVTFTSRTAKSGMPVFQIALTDGTGFIHAVWFNQPYLKDYFRKGESVVLYGKVELYDKVQITQPEYEILKGGDADSLNIGRIVPVYHALANLTQRYLRSLVFAALTDCAKGLSEKLPTYMIARNKLVDIRFAVNNIHFPSSFENLEKAYRRIVFEEFLMLQLALAVKKRDIKLKESALLHSVEGKLADAFKKSITFDLTAGQRKAMADIERDLASGRVMNRLLEGDVGSGKTVVAAYALILTVQNGFQGVLMAPTEVLARQHFVTLSELLMPLGVNVALLVQGIDPKAKEGVYSEIKKGGVDIVVGTHAVIQEAVEFKRLGLVVIDEQHKFGVTQRAVLKAKGLNPHFLVMTATPIPRTLALTVYGDLDISVIRELPKGRKPIATYWLEEEKRGEAYGFVMEELERGRQAYIVCPVIDSETDRRGPQGARELYNSLKEGVFKDVEVALLHGRMRSKDKEKVMRDFKKGKTKALISTVVIEVGIDIPNATVMLVENAERFGLAQLHQLRGRVGRGGHESYFILLSDPKTDAAIERLKAVENTLDGFQIAEADLVIRGPGEFFGTRQHGLPEIRFGNIIKDFDIMELARREAFNLIARDPSLKEEHHRPLKESFVDKFRGRLELARVG